MSFGLFKTNVTYELCHLQIAHTHTHIYIYIYIYTHTQDLALNYPQGLICHKTHTDIIRCLINKLWLLPCEFRCFSILLKLGILDSFELRFVDFGLKRLGTFALNH